MKLNLPNFVTTKRTFQPYVDPTVNLRCSEFEANMWNISNFVIEKLVPVVGTSPYPLNEQMLMVATVCRFKT